MCTPEWQNHSWSEYALPFDHVEHYVSEDGLTFLGPEFLRYDSQKQYF